MPRSVGWQGTGDDLESRQSRAIEAGKIVSRLRDNVEGMRAKDRDFFERLANDVDCYGQDAKVSFKQLIWLRDIYEKVG
jgi:hypothetical protein